MNNALLTKFINKHRRTDIPEFRPGDTIRVHVKIKEGDKERLQAFEGTLIARNNTGMGETITVRKVSFSQGVVVPPGEYVLTATKTAPDKWQIDVKRESGDPIEVPLVAKTLPASVETFTIELTPDKEKSKGELALKWGTTALTAPFTAR